MRPFFAVPAVLLLLGLACPATAATPSFTVSSTIPTGDAPVMPVTADVSDDGNPDVAASFCAGECPPTFGGPCCGGVDVALNGGLGQFGAPPSLAGGFIGATGLVSGDLN